MAIMSCGVRSLVSGAKHVCPTAFLVKALVMIVGRLTFSNHLLLLLPTLMASRSVSSCVLRVSECELMSDSAVRLVCKDCNILPNISPLVAKHFTSVSLVVACTCSVDCRLSTLLPAFAHHPIRATHSLFTLRRQSSLINDHLPDCRLALFRSSRVAPSTRCRSFSSRSAFFICTALQTNLQGIEMDMYRSRTSTCGSRSRSRSCSSRWSSSARRRSE